MTHLVPLAGAIVERRGGMLIHGAIIAREMGIPCVNGIPDIMNLLQNGDFLTVDGDLGIVTLGEAEFNLELRVANNLKESHLHLIIDKNVPEIVLILVIIILKSHPFYNKLLAIYDVISYNFKYLLITSIYPC